MNSYASFCGVSLLIRRDVIVLLSVVHANVVINTPVSSYSTGKKKRICKKNVRRMCPQYPSRATHLAPLPETPLEASASFAGLPVALAPSSVATPPFPPPPSTTTRVASESPAPSLFKAGDSARVGGGSAATGGPARPARWVRRTRRAAARPHPRTHRRLQRAPRVRARTAGTPTSRLIC